MPYRYIEDIAIADVAFEAWGNTLEEMLVSASDATLNIMVRDLDAVRNREYRYLRIAESPADMLLFLLLQELIYYKDAEQLLLRVMTIRVDPGENDTWTAYAEFAGEAIDSQCHDLVVDVKAITLHRFEVGQDAAGWTAHVIVDV